MDDILQDLEAGIPSNTPRYSNKKMRKRKQLDNLLKFRVTNKHSHDLLRSSEDELFLPQRKQAMARRTFPRYDCSKYSQCILSTVLTSVFLTACIGLIYANVELRRDVQDLSLRINEMERRYSKTELTRVLSTIEQVKSRLNILERWNLSLIYNQLQKLQTRLLLNDADITPSDNRHVAHKATQRPQTVNNFDKLSQLSEMMINESAVHRRERLNSLRNDMQNLNRSDGLQGLLTNLDQLTHLVNNSSDQTSLILTELQSDLNQLRRKIDQCECAREPTESKASTMGSSSTARTSDEPNNEGKQTKKENDEVEQIVNRRSVVG